MSENIVEFLLQANDPCLDSQKRKAANQALELFQKDPQAWSVATHLLASDLSQARLFAAQTIRQKLLLDYKLDFNLTSTLKQTLLHSLSTAKDKPYITALLLAIADLAERPLADFIALFQKNHLLILMFFTILAEEFSSSQKFDMKFSVFNDRADSVLKSNSKLALDLLIHILNDSGNQDDSIKKTFHLASAKCVLAWLKTGDFKIEDVMGTAFVDFAFHSLNQSDYDYFDAFSDVISEFIYKSSIIKDNQEAKESIIKSLLQKVYLLLPLLIKSKEDEDKMRGLTRIFVETGESYLDIIVKNFEMFKDLVEAILVCSTNENLDVSKITFSFWFKLSDELRMTENQPFKPLWSGTFVRLVQIIIKHFHYPENTDTTWTSSDRDEFKEFRHEMGDILKDVVILVGQSEALSVPYQIMGNFFLPGTTTFNQNTKWQDVEAVFFSVRAMGREIDPEENIVIPQIMNLLPLLPNHPKIQYAAILALGRYAHWTAKHPEFISYQMQFISRGFEDQASVAAAALALKYLCESCGHLLLDYLGQLHTFYNQSMLKVEKFERRELTEAIANVLLAVPVGNLLESLQQFTLPIAQRLHEISLMDLGLEPDVEVCKEATDLLDRLSTFVKIVDVNVPNEITHPIASLIQDFWPVLAILLEKFITTPVTELICRVLRYSIDNCKARLLPIMPQVLNTIVRCYEIAKGGPYLWFLTKCIQVYGRQSSNSPPGHQQGLIPGEQLSILIVKMTEITISIFQNSSSLDSVPEVIEDYFNLLKTFLETNPLTFLTLPNLPQIITTTITSLQTQNIQSLTQTLLFISNLLNLIPSTPFAPHFNANYALPLMETLFLGLLFTFPREREVMHEVGECLLQLMKGERGGADFKGLLVGLDDGLCAGVEKERVWMEVEREVAGGGGKGVVKVLMGFSNSFRRRNL